MCYTFDTFSQESRVFVACYPTPLTRSCSHSFTLTCSELTCSHTHSLTHSHSLTHTLTHSHTCSLTHSHTWHTYSFTHSHTCTHTNPLLVHSSPRTFTDVLTILYPLPHTHTPPLLPVLPVVFTADTVTVTDDAPSVEVCVEIDGDLVADNVGYRVPIAVETVGGTAGRINSPNLYSPFPV